MTEKTDKQAFLDFIAANNGRSDFDPEAQIREQIAKLERYVEQGGEKAGKYAGKLVEARRVLNFLEAK